MVWSVISAKGLGRLYIVEGTMKQDQYKRVLETQLLPQLEEWFPGDDECIFMHDLAPCHKARSVTAFLKEKKIAVLPWPGNSPDMNPIENMWELTKRAISKQEITTKNQLIETLTNEWNNNDDLKKMAKECIESMPRRIKAIIAAKGGITKYYFFLLLFISIISCSIFNKNIVYNKKLVVLMISQENHPIQ